MSTLDNIICLLNIQHKQQKELTDFLGLHKNAFTDWKNGKSKSYEKYLYQIAAFFDISVEYLEEDPFTMEEIEKAREMFRSWLAATNPTIKGIEQSVHQPYATIKEWSYGNVDYFNDKLYMIADLMGCTLDVLIGKKQILTNLTDSETELIIAYRSHPELQEAVNRILLPNKPSEVKLQISAKKEAPKLAAYGGDFKAPKEKKPKLT